MNKLTASIMWISCAVVCIAGMYIFKNDEMIMIMGIPLLGTIFG